MRCMHRGNLAFPGNLSISASVSLQSGVVGSFQDCSLNSRGSVNCAFPANVRTHTHTPQRSRKGMSELTAEEILSNDQHRPV